MLVELHLLTSHAPANLNRDDFGRPKTALFGGTERARVSSQSQKRVIREYDATRTLYIPQMIYEKLRPEYTGTEDKLNRLRLACEAVTHALGKPDMKKEDPLRLKQIVFVTEGEIGRLREHVRQIVEGEREVPDVNGLLARPKSDKEAHKKATDFIKSISKGARIDEKPVDSVDVALFGRMTTSKDDAFVGMDASMQVAHPLATHATVVETDYFTAVDEWKRNREDADDVETRGSSHINELEFNSALFYKYFSCNLDSLAENLLSDRQAAVEALIPVLDAACRVTPSGKQNSFASHSQADVALLVVREQNMPCSLANAFEQPVKDSDQGYLARSTQRLIERYCRLAYGYEFEDAVALFTVEDFDPRLQKDTLQNCFGRIARKDRLSEVWAFLRERASRSAGTEAEVEA